MKHIKSFMYVLVLALLIIGVANVTKASASSAETYKLT